MASVRLDGVYKTYASGFEALKGVQLEIADGELMVLVGPSGCGKSTALRLIAGLETPTRGRVWIGDRDVTEVRVQDRDVAMVFQSYALYPHKTVRQNLAFALELRRTAPAEIAQRVQRASEMLGLAPLLDRKPAQLSGGQRQRVALGRAIVREPQAFLFDEPLSNLDATLRVQTRAELARLHRRLGATMIYVTHDQEEAMTLGDRIAVMREGRVLQCAPPLDVYRRPADAFVAGFVGNPAMNFLTGAIAPVDGTLQFRSSSLRRGVAVDVSARDERAVRLGIRPHEVDIVSETDADLVGRADVIERLGPDVVVHVDIGGDGAFRVVAASDTRVRADESIGIRLRRDRLHVFDANAGERLG